MRSACTDFHIVWLKQGAALLAPVLLKRKNDLLKSDHVRFPVPKNLDALGNFCIRRNSSRFMGEGELKGGY